MSNIRVSEQDSLIRMKLNPQPPSQDFVTRLGSKVIDNDFGTDLPQGDRDRLLLSTSAGAVAGAAIGTYIGFQSQGGNRINEVWQRHGIEHPKLTGYSHSAVPDYDRDCHYEGSGENRKEVCTTTLEGWWHRYSPDIRRDQVGEYTAPVFKNSNWAEPLLGGFLGAVGGGLLGLGIGVGVNALKRSLNHGSQDVVEMSPKKHDDLAKTAGYLTLGGVALGALGGGILGHVAGVIEQGQKEVHTRDWMGPVMQRTRLGEIPADYYEHNIGLGFPGLGIGFGKGGSQSVYRDVPLYNNDGTPQMQRVQHTFDTGRYGAVSGAILGGLIGGGVGLAAGVASGTLLKMLVSSPPDKPGK